MKLYLCGPCSGIPEFNYPAFRAEARRLRSLGFDVVSPAEICPPGMDWNACMAVCIKALVDCDALALLPGWEASRGATIEVTLAEGLGKSCRPAHAFQAERVAA